MKIYKKAYECALNHVDWDLAASGIDGHWTSTFYGETASKARYQAFLEWSDTFCELKITDIKLRRSKYEDLIEQEPDKVLDYLTESQIKKMKHALGLNRKRESYRNYYFLSNPSKELDELVNIRLMDVQKRDNGFYYFVTDRGKDAMFSTMPVLRCNLDN